MTREILLTLLLKFLIRCRNFLYILLEPLDYASRLINGKKDWPPIYIRRKAGPLSTLEASGGEFLAYLKLIGAVAPTSKILDIGCGFGLMALFLKDFLISPGRYIGVDVDRGLIKWAKKHIYSSKASCIFLHLDVKNDFYNPSGKIAPESIRFPFDDHSFDFILLKSVFTHLRPEAAKNYLNEISRLLTIDGSCLATFFLLNKETEMLTRNGLSRINFRFGSGSFRWAYEGCPELAIAYSEEWLREAIREKGLEIREPIYYGTWSGRKDGLSYQDIVMLKRK